MGGPRRHAGVARMREPRNGPGAGSDALSAGCHDGGSRDTRRTRSCRGCTFPIEKLDAEQGVVRTRPLRARPVLRILAERQRGGLQHAEANVQSIRRTVELRVERKAVGSPSASRRRRRLCASSATSRSSGWPFRATRSPAYPRLTRSTREASRRCKLFDVTPAAAGGDGLDRPGPGSGTRRRDPQADRAKARSIDYLLFTIYYLASCALQLCSVRPQIVNGNRKQEIHADSRLWRSGVHRQQHDGPADGRRP